MIPDPMAGRIRELQADSRLSIQGFAKACGVPYPRMYYVIARGQRPGILTVVKVCRARQVNAEWLLFGSGPRACWQR